MGASCKLFPNKLKRHYGRHATIPFNTRLPVARRMVDVAYGDFIRRQPDGYVSRGYGYSAREPYMPTEDDRDWLERLADYILADDHAKGSMILRDPYDKPRDEDVYTPPGEGAIRYLRSKLAEENAVVRLMTDFDMIKTTAYVNSDFAAIEYLTDVEAVVRNVDPPTPANIVEALKANDIPVNSRYIPDVDGGPGTKQCAVCDMPFVDESRRKDARVCGNKCRRRYKTLWQRVDRFGTTDLEGERNRMQLEYPFYTPNELWLLENRSERSYGDSEKVSRMIAAKQRKEKHGVKHNVTLINTKFTNNRNAVYTWTSQRNAYKFDSWDKRIRWGEIVSYNKNDHPLTESFVDCRGTADRLCPWLN